MPWMATPHPKAPIRAARSLALLSRLALSPCSLATTTESHKIGREMGGRKKHVRSKDPENMVENKHQSKIITRNYLQLFGYFSHFFVIGGIFRNFSHLFAIIRK